jgi:BirA family biotin operon repressor/biotin-[acetyl-CoA-carboxylase] ligase
VAVADEQTAGRGRHGRTWAAPPGRALLVSLGFRPGRLPLEQAWQLGAICAMSMASAAEAVGRLAEGTVRLKWPNDLAVIDAESRPLKLAGVLGESVAADRFVAYAVVGLGVNVDWPASEFPPDLAPGMTSLRELSGGREIDRERLLVRFLDRVRPAYGSLRGGTFDLDGWGRRQATTGAELEVELGDRRLTGVGRGMDPDSGALLLETAAGRVSIASGEVIRCRIHPWPRP